MKQKSEDEQIYDAMIEEFGPWHLRTSEDINCGDIIVKSFIPGHVRRWDGDGAYPIGRAVEFIPRHTLCEIKPNGQVVRVKSGETK